MEKGRYIDDAKGRGRQIVVAVAGGGRGSGKTTLICRLLARFERAAAIKVTHHPLHGKKGPVTTAPSIVMEAGKDTSRFALSGAKKVVFAYSGRGEEEAERNLRRALGMPNGCSPIFVEGGIAARQGLADLVVFCKGATAKPSAEKAMRQAHIIVHRGDPAMAEKVYRLVKELEGGRKRNAVAAAVLKYTKGGVITCTAARKVAQEIHLSPLTVGRLCNEMGIKIDDCVLGCFGRNKQKQKQNRGGKGGGAVVVVEGERGLVVKRKVWIERCGKMVIGEGRARLLREIEKEGSLNKAARKCGLSYRRAWTLIHTMEERSGRKVLRRITGGKGGGGSAITPFGRGLLQLYEKAARMA